MSILADHHDNSASADQAGRAWYARPASMLNRCNLSPREIAESSFQDHPRDITLRWIRQEHCGLWQALAQIDNAQQRAELFHHYTVSWQWWHEDPQHRPCREWLEARSYSKLLRGWGYDSNGPSGAVLKAWAEHRFGLRPIFHGQTLESDPNWLEQSSHQRLHSGMTQVFVQLDLLYTFTQDELRRYYPSQLRLYRGSHDPQAYVIKRQRLDSERGRGQVMELVEFNCLSSFTHNTEIAWEFGSRVWEVMVPRSKIVYHSDLLSQGFLRSEQEYLVLGGDYYARPLLA